MRNEKVFTHCEKAPDLEKKGAMRKEKGAMRKEKGVM
jgi:hypothetical protein